MKELNAARDGYRKRQGVAGTCDWERPNEESARTKQYEKYEKETQERIFREEEGGGTAGTLTPTGPGLGSLAERRMLLTEFLKLPYFRGACERS